MSDFLCKNSIDEPYFVKYAQKKCKFYKNLHEFRAFFCIYQKKVISLQPI